MIGTHRLLLQAIALRTCVEAVYNRTVVKLAPYILYDRGDRLFVDAVTIERGGVSPREPKLGTFQISGLRELKLVAEGFEPSLSFDPEAGKYAGKTLFAI